MSAQLFDPLSSKPEVMGPLAGAFPLSQLMLAGAVAMPSHVLGREPAAGRRMTMMTSTTTSAHTSIVSFPIVVVEIADFGEASERFRV